MSMGAETYVIRALNFGGVTSVEIAVFEVHPRRGRVSTGKRIRIKSDAVLDVVMWMIEAHGALMTLAPANGTTAQDASPRGSQGQEQAW